jgi:3-phosphoshikimate 1-carboxyvinyltransferase
VILISQPIKTGLRGEFSPPGDKSMSHRALIFSSLAEGSSELSGLLESEDTLATMQACQQLGAQVEHRDGKIYVTGTAGDLRLSETGELDMGNSGTAMRLLAGVLAGQSFASRLSGDESLNGRPMRRIVDPLRLMGAQIQPTEDGTAPLTISPSAGGLQGIDYVSPVASAQIKSCVLLAGLYASGTSSVTE